MRRGGLSCATSPVWQRLAEMHRWGPRSIHGACATPSRCGMSLGGGAACDVNVCIVLRRGVDCRMLLELVLPPQFARNVPHGARGGPLARRCRRVSDGGTEQGGGATACVCGDYGMVRYGTACGEVSATLQRMVASCCCIIRYNLTLCDLGLGGASCRAGRAGPRLGPGWAGGPCAGGSSLVWTTRLSQAGVGAGGRQVCRVGSLTWWHLLWGRSCNAWGCGDRGKVTGVGGRPPNKHTAAFSSLRSPVRAPVRVACVGAPSSVRALFPGPGAVCCFCGACPVCVRGVYRTVW